MAEALRLNTTLASIDLGANDLGEGGGSALAKALRLNTTVTSLDLRGNALMWSEFMLGGRALEGALRLKKHGHVARPSPQCSGRGRRAGVGRDTAPQQRTHIDRS